MVYYIFMPENYEIIDAELGAVVVKCNTRAVRITFRYPKGVLSATVPPHLFHNKHYIADVVASHRAHLRRLMERATERMPHQPLIYDGKRIPLAEGDVLIVADECVGRRHVHTREQDGLLTFACHPDDVAAPAFHVAIARYILRRITQRYGGVLVDLVKEEAQRHGLQVKEIRLGRGRRTLGHCSRCGVITISIHVLFMPPHLRRYIVCHELAHLTHFDHSASFHRLCDKYCQGNEMQWRKEMRRFVSPLSI